MSTNQFGKKGWTPERIGNLNGKTFVITGTTSGSFMMKIIFGLMKLLPLTQPAENGAYPELMCATEPNLDQKAFYGPTGRNNWVGPVGAHPIKSHAKDKAVAKKLWDLSEEATGVKWPI